MTAENDAESKAATPPSTPFSWTAALAALFAIGIHAYLLKAHYDLHYGTLTGKLSCDISSLFSCSATSASRWSELLGVPMALWGLLANLAYVFFAGWDFFLEPNSRHGNRTNALVTAAVIAIASVVMGAITVTALQSICPFCLATYALSIITLFGAWRAYRPGLRLSFKPNLAITAAVLAGAGFVADDQIRSEYSSPQSDALIKAAISEWQQNPSVEIAETDPLAMGPSRQEAKLTLVEFADFRCIHCKMAAAPIKAFVSSRSDVRLEYYSWPLDGECNTSIQQNNGASCLLARMVWCARKKADKGWQAHEAVFARFEEWRTAESVRSGLAAVAQEIGMSADELKTCADSAEAKAAIEAQARLGTGFNISGTPAIFANGKLLPGGAQLNVLSRAYQAL